MGCLDQRPGMGDHEIDKLLTLEELGADLMALPRDDDQTHLAAQGTVAPRQLAGVLVQRDHVVGVTVDVQDRDARLGQRG